MPNTKAAAKRLRQNTRRRTRNRSAKRTVKTLCTKVEEVLAEGSPEQAAAEFRLAAQKLDQAAAKGIIHPNAAARKKSRLSARLKAKK